MPISPATMTPPARSLHAALFIALPFALLTAACGGGGSPAPAAPPAANRPPVLSQANPDQTANTGVAFQYDASRGGAAFNDPDGDPLTYRLSLSAPVAGLATSGATLAGTAAAAGTTTVTVTADDGRGGSASNSFTLTIQPAVSANPPTLPATLLGYSDAAVSLPAHLLAGPGSVAGADNTPPGNPITDAGATLGRVLFYDKRLSANDTVACGSCHVQSRGFADAARFSSGFQGALTPRHSMGLSNARYYNRGRFFWDERATTLEAQVLEPIQNSVEMGMTLPQLTTKLAATSYYPALFAAAFGDAAITSDRIARSLAQFVRAMVSYRSKYDSAFVNGTPNFAAVFTAQEEQGRLLFEGRGRCAGCHGTVGQIAPGLRNNGLDAVTIDAGAGQARFKSPSLRNVAVRAPYMHDGRFATLLDVINHYDSGVQPHPDLDPALRNPDGSPRRLNLTPAERQALLTFLGTLTDNALLTDVRFSSPFAP